MAIYLAMRQTNGKSSKNMPYGIMIDFRLPQLAWRERFHRLDKWLTTFNQRPSMQKTGYANKS